MIQLQCFLLIVGGWNLNRIQGLLNRNLNCKTRIQIAKPAFATIIRTHVAVIVSFFFFFFLFYLFDVLLAACSIHINNWFIVNYWSQWISVVSQNSLIYSYSTQKWCLCSQWKLFIACAIFFFNMMFLYKKLYCKHIEYEKWQWIPKNLITVLW